MCVYFVCVDYLTQCINFKIPVIHVSMPRSYYVYYCFEPCSGFRLFSSLRSLLLPLLSLTHVFSLYLFFSLSLPIFILPLDFFRHSSIKEVACCFHTVSTTFRLLRMRIPFLILVTIAFIVCCVFLSSWTILHISCRAIQLCTLWRAHVVKNMQNYTTYGGEIVKRMAGTHTHTHPHRPTQEHRYAHPQHNVCAHKTFE